MKNDENIFERLKDMYIKLLKLTFCLYLLKFFLLLKIPVCSLKKSFINSKPLGNSSPPLISFSEFFHPPRLFHPPPPSFFYFGLKSTLQRKNETLYMEQNNKTRKFYVQEESLRETL